MTDWGVCTTVKAPEAQVLAFARHHLALGASRLWLHFDDPEDPAAEAAGQLPRVRAIRCDTAYWLKSGGRRPDKHQSRQSRNMQRVYLGTRLPWIAHLDVDEFLWPRRLVAEVLDGVPATAAQVRCAPWEALHDPSVTQGAFPARHFRAAIPGAGQARLRDRVFGPYAALLPQGVLSHSAGKCFFRTGIAGLEPRLHGAFMAGRRVPGGAFNPDLPLLHFHAHDPADWTAKVAFRVAKGAYQYNPALASYLGGATAAEISAFYDRVQVAHPQTLAALRAAGALIEAEVA